MLELFSGDVYSFTLGFDSVQGFSETADEKVIRIYTGGEVFTGDQLYKSNLSWVEMRYDTQEVLAQEYAQSWVRTTVGSLHYDIDYIFSDCLVENEKIIFAFEPVDSSDMTYIGTEIFLNYDQEDEVYVVAFRNTISPPSSEFIDSIQAMKGINTLSASQVESYLFSGTELMIKCDDGYSLEYYFNTDGTQYEFVNFYFLVIS